MQAYVINLSARTDRWEAVLSQWNLDPLPLNRIEAVASQSIPLSETFFLPAPVVANWMSQCKTYRKFLTSTDSHALILEDDFLIGSTDLNKIRDICMTHEFDFLQLGYLRNSILDVFNVRFTNIRDVILKFINSASRKGLLPKFLNNKLLVLEQIGIPYSVVLNDARAGSHAYIISRKFAEKMLTLNQPTFLPTDALFMAISNLRFLRMGRLRKNRIRQSNSPSSITSRFISI